MGLEIPWCLALQGSSTKGVFLVQSPPTETKSSGRDAASAAISALLVSSLTVLWTFILDKRPPQSRQFPRAEQGNCWGQGFPQN